MSLSADCPKVDYICETDTAILRVGKQDIHIAAGGCKSQVPSTLLGHWRKICLLFESKEEGAWSGGLEVKDAVYIGLKQVLRVICMSH